MWPYLQAQILSISSTFEHVSLHHKAEAISQIYFTKSTPYFVATEESDKSLDNHVTISATSSVSQSLNSYFQSCHFIICFLSEIRLIPLK